jgi:ribose-phosphate pyrophosphokinase
MDRLRPEDIIIVGNVTDDPFAIDVARFFGQEQDISDLISLKDFANREFCPRFIWDENDFIRIGTFLGGKTVFVVSTCCGNFARDTLAMRNFLIARAAKDNGAQAVYLIEPDLFYSAQDRGPQPEEDDSPKRSKKDLKKFDGQPFSAQLYGQLLRASGFDGVITVHNHSESVIKACDKIFPEGIFNLFPYEIYTHYLATWHFGFDFEGKKIIFAAPDGGAYTFTNILRSSFIDSSSQGELVLPLLVMKKARKGERQVSLRIDSRSKSKLADVDSAQVVVTDDMVRTGTTIVRNCQVLKEAGAKSITFIVTHFYPSEEVKQNLNDPSIDDIVTTNSLPTVLNRDMQGRLRKKMLVLKIEAYIAQFLLECFCGIKPKPGFTGYTIDVSSKNPRWLTFNQK